MKKAKPNVAPYTLSSSDSDSDNNGNGETKLTEKQNYCELSSSSSDHELLSDDIIFNDLKQKFGCRTDQPCASTSQPKRKRLGNESGKRPGNESKINEENETNVPRRRKRASKNVTKTVTESSDANEPTFASAASENDVPSEAAQDSNNFCNKIEIDPRLLNLSFAANLLANLQSNQIQYDIKEQPLSSCIFCPINMINDNDDSFAIKSLVLILRTFTELAPAIQKNNLKKYVVDMIPTSIHDCRIILIIFGSEDYLRHEKLNRSREMKRAVQASNSSQQTVKRPTDDDSSLISLNRVQIENALAQFQFSSRFQYSMAENGDELAQMVVRYVKGFCELPNNLRKNKNRDRVNWFAEADGKNCVQVDANGNGLSSLWQQQIMQFSNVGLEAANAIISVYSSPKALIQAYDRCSSVRDAELLLQDITVRRKQGPLSNARRIGPELSKKIYAFFKDHQAS